MSAEYPVSLIGVLTLLLTFVVDIWPKGDAELAELEIFIKII
jgi:hypothetical protein